MTISLLSTDFQDLELVHRGKVRDMYAITGHEDKLLMVATDRISAYDVVMDDPIPGKGKVLTALSLFWFDLLADVAENHLISADVDEYPQVCHQYKEQL
ncbi:MAG TPA: phosphoribosylaminoimidazolesuccinocarboxamide synthase, partial [Desulfopila sp.]|nr:phosphoribosylaminoimidazolesuccinocarboxamide synthase [Desulfopila sp.]